MGTRQNTCRWAVIWLLVVVTCNGAFAGKTIYVDADATGANNGSSWQSAYTSLQQALTDAEVADKPIEIRVAQGIYKPYQGSWQKPTDSIASFNLINEVTIAGGYAGFGEPDPNERDIVLYETILSGDLNGDDIDVNDPCDMLLVQFNRGDNSHTIVTGNNTNETAILDGFTVTGGHYMAVSMNGPSGGAGIYIWSGSPTIVNCTFTGNAAFQAGGGLYNTSSSPTLINCKFEKNYAEFGAGMYNRKSWYSTQRSKPTLIDCTFSDNYAGREGGGIYNYKSDPNLINCTFNHNFALAYGAGIYNSYSNTELVDSAFIENTAGSGGGIYSEDNSNLILSNCIIWKNAARHTGGGMCNADANSILLSNCLLSNNSAEQAGGGLAGSGNKTTLVNCTFSGNKVYGESTDSSKGGGFHAFGDSVLINCTFSGNWAQQGHAIFKYSSSDLRLTNCILWDDGTEIFQKSGAEPDIVYSNVQGGWPGDGNIDADPLFADPGHWASVNDPDIVVEPNHPNAIWIDGDYHLKSQAGRWDPNPPATDWVKDDVTSPCIDAGDPMSPIGPEPFPNGGIINMGAYGATVEASKSYFGEPVCETIVAGDINGDCRVDFTDFKIMALHWLDDNSPRGVVTTIYQFQPDPNALRTSGGIHGQGHGGYCIEGQFQLTVDFSAGIASFKQVGATVSEEISFSDFYGEDPISTDSLDVLFHMTEMVSFDVNDTAIELVFEKNIPSFPLADVSMKVTFSDNTDDTVRLVGSFCEPVYDGFCYHLDAIAIEVSE